MDSEERFFWDQAYLKALDAGLRGSKDTSVAFLVTMSAQVADESLAERCKRRETGLAQFKEPA